MVLKIYMVKVLEKQIFLNDSYLKRFKSNLLSITSEGHLIFEKGIFYALSGGQPGDEGSVSWDDKSCNIIATIKDQAGNIRLVPHEGQELPPKGKECLQEINWDKRFRYMRTHTALHLLSVVIPLPVTGGQISENKGRLDFNMPEPLESKEVLEGQLNEIIFKDYKITESWITDSELDSRPNLVKTMSVSPPRGVGKVRLIRIGDEKKQIDLQPCGGTHVKSTSEIGKVRFGKIESKGKQNRRVSINLE